MFMGADLHSLFFPNLVSALLVTPVLNAIGRPPQAAVWSVPEERFSGGLAL